MRTTITFDDDVAAAVQRMRRQEGLGLSQAVNRLIRNGLGRAQARSRVALESQDLGLRIDVSNVAEALEVGEGPAWR